MTLVMVVACAGSYVLDPAGWLPYVILAFLVSCTMSYYAMPNVLAVSYKKSLYDMPGGRHAHQMPVPRLGGVVFAPITICAVALAISLRAVVADASVEVTPRVLMWICSLVLLYLVGIVDDLTTVRYKVKFAFQVLCGLLMILSGIWFNDLYGLFGIHALPAWVGMPLTVLAVVLIINAVNLIDGIDGLASGLSGIAVLAFGVLFAVEGRWLYSIIAFASLGVLVPFFYCNVCGWAGRHKLFMGDTGSLTIGMIIGMLAVRFSMNTGPRLMGEALVVAMSLLMVPVFDAVMVFVIRLRQGNHPFKPDRNHIHHRFIAMGLRPRTAMVAILGVAMVCASLNIVLSYYLNINLLFVLDVVLWLTLYFAVEHRTVVRRGKAGPAPETGM